MIRFNSCPILRLRADLFPCSHHGWFLLAAFFTYWPQLVAVAQTEQNAKIPEPQDIDLVADGVRLRCTWYPGTLGKKAVPFIMLHGWGGVRGDYSAAANELQKRGHAVIVPDLRGHGESKYRQAGDRVEEIDRERLGKQLLVEIGKDIEAVKNFLLAKNDAGELNIELLCVVAADAMCIAAMNWAIQDWSWPTLLTGKKQGRDVKALVLLSPPRSFKGLTSTGAMRHPLFTGRGPFTLSLLILVGERDRDALRDAQTIHSTLERNRPKPPAGLKGRELLEKADLFILTRDVEFQGTKLLDPQFKLEFEKRIAEFVSARVESRQAEYSWQNRSP